jgi:hypothetical protein
MPTRGLTRYIGVVCVIPATGRKPEERSVASRLSKGLDTKSVVNVNFVATKHRNLISWMCILLMAIFEIQKLQI